MGDPADKKAQLSTRSAIDAHVGSDTFTLFGGESTYSFDGLCGGNHTGRFAFQASDNFQETRLRLRRLLRLNLAAVWRAVNISVNKRPVELVSN